MLEPFDPAAIDLLFNIPSFSQKSLDIELLQISCYHSLVMGRRILSTLGDLKLNLGSKRSQNILPENKFSKQGV